MHAQPEDQPAVWLDSARIHPITGRWSLFAFNPWLYCAARGNNIILRTDASTTHWQADPLKVLRMLLERYRTKNVEHPFIRVLGLVGFLSYGINQWIEALPVKEAHPRKRASAVEPSEPDMLFYGMRSNILVDHQQNCTWMIGVSNPNTPKALARQQAKNALESVKHQIGAKVLIKSKVCLKSNITAISTQASFERMVRRTLKQIKAGEIFQANISQRFVAEFEGDSRNFYSTLRRINPSPFACWLSSDDLSIISASPERLVRVQDDRVDTRPIAGTRPRGATPKDDVINSLELLLSEKEQAEHLMLVDLERNDLGRICQTGSINVDEFKVLEEYSHVIHIVSQVSGKLRSDCDLIDVIRATFPGGTITGCPKVRCMELLQETEPVNRGLYTGSLGTIGFSGMMDLNIAIRTIITHNNHLAFHVGAGIVADSDPKREYEETLAKAAALIKTLHSVDNWTNIDAPIS